jgi:hypothetical protein
MVLSLEEGEQKNEGMLTLQRPVFTVIRIPDPNQFVTTMKADLETPWIDANEEYEQRVHKLSDNISRSLDRILSQLSLNELKRHVDLAGQGLSLHIFSHPHAAEAAHRYCQLPPESVEPDGVGIQIIS